MTRSVRTVGVWTGDAGDTRVAAVGIEVAPDGASVTIGTPDEPDRDRLPAPDRRTAYYLGCVEAAIRADHYRNRPIVSDPKPKERGRRRRSERG